MRIRSWINTWYFNCLWVVGILWLLNWYHSPILGRVTNSRFSSSWISSWVSIIVLVGIISSGIGTSNIIMSYITMTELRNHLSILLLLIYYTLFFLVPSLLIVFIFYFFFTLFNNNIIREDVVEWCFIHIRAYSWFKIVRTIITITSRIVSYTASFALILRGMKPWWLVSWME